MYSVTIAVVRIIIGSLLRRFIEWAGYPASSDIPAITTFAEAPIKVPLPPKQAPNAKAQISGQVRHWLMGNL